MNLIKFELKNNGYGESSVWLNPKEISSIELNSSGYAVIHTKQGRSYVIKESAESAAKRLVLA